MKNMKHGLLFFRLIFVVVLLGGMLTGCMPTTAGTMDFPEASDVRSLSIAMQTQPTGNVTAQFHVSPCTEDTAKADLLFTNHNAFAVVVAVEDTICLDIYGSYGHLIETVKNQHFAGQGTRTLTIQPGQSVMLETFSVSKSGLEQRLLLSQLTFTVNGDPESKVQSVTALI